MATVKQPPKNVQPPPKQVHQEPKKASPPKQQGAAQEQATKGKAGAAAKKQGHAFAEGVRNNKNVWGDFGKLRADFMKLDTSKAREVALDELHQSGNADLRQLSRALKDATPANPKVWAAERGRLAASTGESAHVASAAALAPQKLAMGESIAKLASARGSALAPKTVLAMGESIAKPGGGESIANLA